MTCDQFVLAADGWKTSADLPVNIDFD